MTGTTYVIQASADAGYFLFPHQPLSNDSLGLPPYCFTNGHPGTEPEPWEGLSRVPGKFSNSDKVLLFQVGKPSWLRGFWGFGSIVVYGNEVRVRSTHMLSTPLVVADRLKRRLKAPVLRTLLGINPAAKSYQGTFAEIPPDDFDLLKGLIEQREPGHLSSVVRERFSHGTTARDAKTAFESWAKRKGWDLFSAGYPDILAQAPNGRVVCFEAKDRQDVLSDRQREMFNILGRKGMEILVLNDVPNRDVEKVVRKSGWTIIAKGRRVTIGWPDYVLSRDGSVVACELKTGIRESVSEDQLATLSALANLKDFETHVVRAIPDSKGKNWTLYDDTERWFSYPP